MGFNSAFKGLIEQGYNLVAQLYNSTDLQVSILLFYFILFYFILFCFILFYFILFYFISFRFVLFYFIYFISFHFISFHFVSFRFVSFRFVLFYFILFYFILFYFILFYFVLFYFIFIITPPFNERKPRNNKRKLYVSSILHPNITTSVPNLQHVCTNFVPRI